jgi:formylglycine-generating enzyme required for sulfatase activity
VANYAWYSNNSGDQTHPVGRKLPNAWGLYDMHGNVWEWCQVWWADSLPGGIALDPQGPASGSDRVIRGGYWQGWYGDASCCRSAARFNSTPRSTGSDSKGFRAVRAPGQP